MLLVLCYADAAQLASCVILAVDRPCSTPGAVLVLHAVVLADQLVFLLAVPELLRWPFNLAWAAEAALTIGGLSIVLVMPMRDPLLGHEDIARPFEPATSEKRSPEDNFSLWHWMTVSWMNPLIHTAFSKRLDGDDVWLLPYQFQHERLFRLFREVKGSVTARIFKANAPDLFITTGLGILESVTNLLSIVLLKPLLAALEGPRPDIRAAVVYAVLILFVNLVRAQSSVFSYWFTRRCYERSRGEMITMIYDKTLRRKAFTIPSQHQGQKDDAVGDAAKAGPASTGKILNLMRNDVYEVAQRFWDFPTFVTKPLDVVLSVILVWRILGPAALLGILVLVTALVLNYFIVKVMVKFEVRRRRVTDLKLQVTSQFIEAIRHLRWYDWQDKWLGDILTHRQRELHLRVIRSLLRRVIVLLNQLAATFFPVAAFYAYTVIGGQPLVVEVAFPALNLFNLLDSSVSQIPDMITSLLDAAVAMRRIENFMAEPDKADSHVEESTPPTTAPEINITMGGFAWPGVSKPVLTGVDLRCEAGLTLVCGKVGTGKTALLQAILGEMDQHHGGRTVPREMIGYCAQLPWLQSMSIKDNILFCAPYDKARFDEVIDACCLRQDLDEFEAGENSFVGENGVGLSGGQKARVALARAVYSRARILLLDDPIAALDHQTAETILWRLFSSSGLMKERLVVFVTHRVDLVTEYADQVVEIKDDGSLSCFRPKDLSSDEDLLERVTSGNGHPQDMPIVNGSTDVVAKKFMEEEHRAHGGVVASVYWRYIKAGSVGWWAATILLFVGFRIAKIAYFYYLKVWGEAYEHTRSHGLLHLQVAAFDRHDAHVPAHAFGWFDNFESGLPPPEENPKPWLFWLAIIALGPLITRTLALLTLLVVQYTAGKKMFRDLMVRVSKAPFRFFDVTPVGRLMNRVTSDIGTIDGQIPEQIYNTVWSLLNWASAMIVIASTTPVFLALAVFMSATFAVIFRRFLPASQSLRRLETTSLSPLMSNFGTIIEGLTTVRAFRAQPYFQQRNIVTTDDFQKMDHFYWSLQAWLQVRYDALSAVSTFALTITALRLGLSSGTIGFVLAAAANFVNSTHNLCRRYGALQMQFVSVERVIELLDLETEDVGDVAPPAAWPTSRDDIVFDDVSIRYAPQLDPVLRDVSLRIPAGSTVAVTGRTGSGKTTLALALLGTVLPDAGPPVGGRSGGIFIGGVDVSRVDKHALRRRVSFVAQDPVLFPGTLRANLDPLGDHSDDECAAVLARVMSGAGDFTIHSRVDGGGKNMSQGQRQLVGLARAVLRRSPIVILDEVRNGRLLLPTSSTLRLFCLLDRYATGDGPHANPRLATGYRFHRQDDGLLHPRGSPRRAQVQHRHHHRASRRGCQGCRLSGCAGEGEAQVRRAAPRLNSGAKNGYSTFCRGSAPHRFLDHRLSS